MTRQEAIKILSVLKAAYPNSYRGMTKDEANGVVGVWASQFSELPYAVVSIAVSKLISTNAFPPTIAEVRGRIRELYWEAQCELPCSEGGIVTNFEDKKLSTATIKLLKQIIKVGEPMQNKTNEITLGELLKGYGDCLPAGTEQDKS